MEYVKVAVESEADLVNQIVRGKIVKEIANDIYLLER